MHNIFKYHKPSYSRIDAAHQNWLSNAFYCPTSFQNQSRVLLGEEKGEGKKKKDEKKEKKDKKKEEEEDKKEK